MAAVAPVNVTLPGGPAQPDSPILVDAADAIYTSLPWLPWGPVAVVGGVARASLKHSEAMKAFAVRCQFDRSPAALAALMSLL